MLTKYKKNLYFFLILIGITYIFLTPSKKIVEGASDCGKGCDPYCRNHENLIKSAKKTCERARDKVRDVDDDAETVKKISDKIDKIQEKMDKMNKDDPCD